MSKNCRPLAARILSALILAPFMAAMPAGAALQDLGNGLIDDADLKVTWTKDANLFATQFAADPDLINKIIALTPTTPDTTLGDPTTGQYTLSSSDFTNPDGTNTGPAVDGAMTWFGAMAWIKWLNSQNYGGYADWRLPKVSPVRGNALVYPDGTLSGNEFCDDSGDTGYNKRGTSNELGHLFYDELGGVAAFQTAKGGCSTPNDSFGVARIDPFLNFQKGRVFWSGTEFTSPFLGPGSAWFFSMGDGGAGGSAKTDYRYALPVRGEGGGVIPGGGGNGGGGSGGGTSGTTVAGDYDFAGTPSCTGSVDRKGRRVRMTLPITNGSSAKKPVARLSVTAQQNGQTYQLAPRSRKVAMRPSAQRNYRAVWKIRGAGTVTLTATLQDADTSDDAQDTVSCTIPAAQ